MEIDRRELLTREIVSLARNAAKASGLRDSFEIVLVFVARTIIQSQRGWAFGGSSSALHVAASKIDQLDAHHLAESEFRRVWLKFSAELGGFFGFDLGVTQSPSLQSCSRFVNGISVAMGQSEDGDWEFVCDQLLQYRFESVTAAHRNRAALSLLMAAVSPGGEVVVDGTKVCGEIPIILSGSGSASQGVVLSENVDRFAELRLALRGVRVMHGSTISTEGVAVFAEGDDSLRFISDMSPAGDKSFLGVNLAGVNERISACLLLGGGLLSAPNYAYRRQGLLSEFSVDACISLPSKLVGGRVNCVLVVLRKRAGRRGALMVDFASVAKILGSSSDLVTALLIRGMISLLDGSVARWDGALGEAYISEANRILSNEFGGQYRSISGVTNLADDYKMELSGYSLRPRDYIGEYGAATYQGLLREGVILSAIGDGSSRQVLYIIGDNGVGKSMLLRDVCKGLGLLGLKTMSVCSGINDRFHAASRSAGHDYRGDRTSRGSISAAGSVRIFSKRLEEVAVQQDRLDAFFDFIVEFGFAPEVVFIDSRNYDRGDEVLGFEHARITVDAFRNGPVVGAHRRGLRPAFRREAGGGVFTSMDSLSSGEWALLNLALKIISGVDPGSVVVVDEPEASLHVIWQRAFPGALKSISDRLAVSIVVATHSPLVVASASALGDRCYVARSGELAELDLPAQESVGGVLLDGFSTYTPNSLDLYQRCATAVARAVEGASSIGAHQNVQESMLELTRLSALVQSAPLEIRQSSGGRDVALLEAAKAAVQEVAHQLAVDG